MRAAKAHWHAETLCAANDDIGTHFPGRGQQAQRQRVGGDDGERAERVGGGNFGRQITQRASAAGILQYQRERLGGGDRGNIAGRDIDQGDPERPGARRQHRAGLRVEVGSNRQHV